MMKFFATSVLVAALLNLEGDYPSLSAYASLLIDDRQLAQQDACIEEVLQLSEVPGESEAKEPFDDWSDEDKVNFALDAWKKQN